MSRRTEWAAVTLTLLLAAALRFGGLGQVPPGLAHDEVANGLIARDILAGRHAIYFTAAYGHEPLYQYVQAASVALFAAGILLTRHYGVQAGELRALAREKRPYRLTHSSPGILIRLVLALAATAGSGWIHFEASLTGWLAHVPVVSGVVAVLLVLHFFRELVLGAVEDVRRED